MVPSFRKFVGTIVLVTFVIVYAFVAMVVGDMSLQQASTPVKLVYYAIAGLIWVIPAGAIISWMQKSKS